MVENLLGINLFPNRQVNMGLYKDKFPLKPIDYSKYREKSVVSNYHPLIKEFNESLT